MYIPDGKEERMRTVENRSAVKNRFLSEDVYILQSHIVPQEVTG